MPVYNQELYRKDKHWKEGEFDVYRNMQWTGPGCHEGCGVLFYVKDGKIDHIEGDPNDEFSRGRLCMRCLNMVDEAINNLTAQCVVGETGYGAPYRCLLCKVYKCTPANSEVMPSQVVAESLAR